MRLLITLCAYCSIQVLATGAVGADSVQLVCDAEASPRIAFGVERLKEALVDAGLEVLAVDAATVRPENTVISVGKRNGAAVRALAPPVGLEVQDRELGPEGFSLRAMGSRVAVIGEGDSGVLYGCLELASRVRDQGGLPNQLAETDRPAFKLRGTCIGMQKPHLLPGRRIYEYPYTEELFPFFYDKVFWREYLDFLVDRRMNLLSLWNGHPFGSLIRLDDYPYAVEVSGKQFERNVATDPRVVIPAALDVYRNLYTESKYNGESLTTWRPRGSKQRTHLELARLGSTHVVNVHILANLEPFRYGAQRFIKKSVQAARDRLDAGGLHVYPLAFWNWPHSADAVHPPLRQINRDRMWFDAWARYAWDPDVDADRDRLFWIGHLTEAYGSTEAAPLILGACNDAGECAPRLVRRLGITEGNRQTLSLGMTLDQLVNPEKYRPGVT